jgi:hypothetical protein
MESECADADADAEAEAKAEEGNAGGEEEGDEDEDEDDDAEEAEGAASATLLSLSASAARSASRVRSFSSWRALISRASWSGSSVMSWVFLCFYICIFFFEWRRKVKKRGVEKGEGGLRSRFEQGRAREKKTRSDKSNPECGLEK